MILSTPMLYFLTLSCVVANATGQLLFKYSAELANKNETILSSEALIVIGLALTLYLLAAIGWTIVLRTFDVVHIYPLMALVFILVPVGAHVFFNEEINSSYFLGTLFIILGIVISMKFS